MSIIILTIVIAILLPCNVMAAPNVANTSTMGSAFILPVIQIAKTDIDGNIVRQKTTLISITNNGETDAVLRCVYADQEFNTTEIDFAVNKRETVVIDATSGTSSKGQMVPFPFNTQFIHDPGPDSQFFTSDDQFSNVKSSGVGELFCVSVNVLGQIRTHNYLDANATIVDYFNGTSASYNAWMFPMKEIPGFLQGDMNEMLNLSGNFGAFSACPKFLSGDFSRKNSVLAVNDIQSSTPTGVTVTTGANFLGISTCKKDFSTDWNYNISKLDFDVWNSDGVKLTGAYTCMHNNLYLELTQSFPGPGTIIQSDLGQAPVTKWSHAGSMVFDSIGTTAGSYRIHAVTSPDCDQEIKDRLSDQDEFAQSTNAGLVGVAVGHRTISLADANGNITTNTSKSAFTRNLIGRGTRSDGFIKMTPAIPTNP